MKQNMNLEERYLVLIETSDDKGKYKLAKMYSSKNKGIRDIYAKTPEEALEILNECRKKFSGEEAKDVTKAAGSFGVTVKGYGNEPYITDVIIKKRFVTPWEEIELE